MARTFWVALTTLIISLILWGVFVIESKSHGWYPFECCSGYDCRPVKKEAILRTSKGYVIKNTGELIPYTDRRVRVSRDEEWHWCSMSGKPDGTTICLFVPPIFF